MDIQGKSEDPSLDIVPRDRSLQQYPSNCYFEGLATLEGRAPTSIFSSPASPAFGLSSAMHGSNVGTIQSLLMKEPFLPASSTASTALPMPWTYNELPEMIYSCEVPLEFSTNCFDGSDNLSSLVLNQNATVAVPSVHAVDDSRSKKSDGFRTAQKPPKPSKAKECKLPSRRRYSMSGAGSRCYSQVQKNNEGEYLK